MSRWPDGTDVEAEGGEGVVARLADGAVADPAIHPSGRRVVPVGEEHEPLDAGGEQPRAGGGHGGGRVPAAAAAGRGVDRGDADDAELAWAPPHEAGRTVVLPEEQPPRAEAQPGLPGGVRDRQPDVEAEGGEPARDQRAIGLLRRPRSTGRRSGGRLEVVEDLGEVGHGRRDPAPARGGPGRGHVRGRRLGAGDPGRVHPAREQGAAERLLATRWQDRDRERMRRRVERAAERRSARVLDPGERGGGRRGGIVAQPGERRREDVVLERVRGQERCDPRRPHREVAGDAGPQVHRALHQVSRFRRWWGSGLASGRRVSRRSRASSGPTSSRSAMTPAATVAERCQPARQWR
jgi:hypothetical protein